MPNVAFQRKEYQDAKPSWDLVRDCVAGSRRIKAAREKYLPSPNTSGDTEENRKRYDAYLKRAVFYGVTGRTLSGLVAEVFRKPTEIKLPSELEFMESDIDGAGTSADTLARSVLEEVFTSGRAGLLSDFPTLVEGQVVTRADLESGRIRPRVIEYKADQIINWRESNVGGETLLTMVTLEESAVISDDGFEFKTEPRWREYRLDNYENSALASASVTVWRKSEKPKDANSVYEIVEGPTLVTGYDGRPLSRIPFCFVGAQNNDSSVDDPPLLSIAELNVSHYCDSADVQESSFLVGQPTLFMGGMTQEWMDKNYPNGVFFGSRGALTGPTGCNAELLQAEPNTMPGELMKRKEEQMKALGARLIEPKSVSKTATEAAIDASAEESVLSSGAKNVSDAVSRAIWNASKFIGAFSQDDIEFELNSDFDVSRMSAQDRAQLIAEWQGELITWGEARAALRKAGVATEDDDEARGKIDAEASTLDGFDDSQDQGDGQEPAA